MDKCIKKMWYIHTMEYHPALESNPTVYNNMDEPQGQYAVKQASHRNKIWFHLYEVSKITESRKVVGKGWGKERGKLVLNGSKVSVL